LEERTIEINLPESARRLTGALVLANATAPVETVGAVAILVDGVAVSEQTVSVAAPLALDLAVEGKHRVTVRLNVHPNSIDAVDNATFVVHVVAA
jgi:hypothetical protein